MNLPKSKLFHALSVAAVDAVYLIWPRWKGPSSRVHKLNVLLWAADASGGKPRLVYTCILKSLISVGQTQ